MNRIAVINVVGLTKEHLGECTPHITTFANRTSVSSLIPPLPAVTCTVQASMLTGLDPCEHGIVANGWHERKTGDTAFWRQSNDLVHGKKVWDVLQAMDSEFTACNMFWWFNMYSSVDIAVTPRPVYCEDGRKIPDVWTTPSDLRESLQKKFGQFPLFHFWGPAAGIASSKWIVESTIEVDTTFSPTLTLAYIPHLDYSMQRVGPDHESIPSELRAVDAQVGRLINHYAQQHVEVCILSEYAIEPVTDAVAINRELRDGGFLSIREEQGREYLDAHASSAFAVPDHQLAHVYVRQSEHIQKVVDLLQNTHGIDKVFSGDDRGELAHERCGEIVAISDHNKWFSHDWWFDPDKAPEYQHTVDIHAKPGYDPRELILADGWRGSRFRIALKLLMKKLGSSSPMDVIALDTTKVRGSHGRTPAMGAPSPILIAPNCAKEMPQSLPAAALHEYLIQWITS